MSFIGIISDEKNENYIRKQILKKLKISESNVLFIKEKTIENLKNIRFETIILEREFEDLESLKKLLINTKYLIVNADLNGNLEKLGQLELVVITYGFNSKATITISSVMEDKVLICLQRNIENINKKVVVAQEFEVKKDKENINLLMAISAIYLIYGKII